MLVARQQVADSQSRNPVAGQSQTIPDPKRWKTGSVTILGGSLSSIRLFQMTAQELYNLEIFVHLTSQEWQLQTRSHYFDQKFFLGHGLCTCLLFNVLISLTIC